MARRPPKTFTRGGMTTGAVEQHLRELGEHVLQAAKAALKEGADMVVKDAKSRCPVYEGHKKENGQVYHWAGAKPGALRDSIQAEPNSKGTVYAISANAKSEDGYLYGQILEFSPKVNRPFLYPALDANKQAVSDMIQDAIKNAIRRG